MAEMEILMLRLAICEDNVRELSEMVSLVEEYRTLHRAEYQCSVFHNGFELASVLEKKKSFDVYLLDILMPGFSGMDLAKEIRAFDHNAQIIFFTSSPEFALESYSVRAFHYLVKPVTRETVFSVLTEVLERIEKEQGASIVVKSLDGLQKILLSKLTYLEAMGKKTVYHVYPDRTVKCMEKFSITCESLGSENQFLKPHRSYLVNMNYIDRISNTEIILQTGARVPIAQGKSREIKESYLAFQMEE